VFEVAIVICCAWSLALALHGGRRVAIS